MNLLFILTGLFLSTPLLAKPVVLVSYYDAFENSPYNNSEVAARQLSEKLQNSAVDIKLCSLNTVFDRAYAQVDECLKKLGTPPAMILGLGETGCKMKVESVLRNRDETYGPDNAGVERDSQLIIPDAPAFYGATYPVAQMFCGADPDYAKKKIVVSNDAGSFVCNNTAFQLTHYYPEIPSGFIHLPSHDCKNVRGITEEATTQLAKMVLAGVRSIGQNILPMRFPTTKSGLKEMKEMVREDQCLSTYLARSKAAQR